MSASKLKELFDNTELLDLALTHRSVAGRSGSGRNNERLEFLGDAVLGYVVAEFLYNKFEEADEGQLTRTRAALVNKRTLATVARHMDIGDAVVLGEGEQKSGGWRRDSILSNTLEAIIGALYLDQGVDSCRKHIYDWFARELAEADPENVSKDPKTKLQEALQAHGLELPVYETLETSGPPHRQLFTVSCDVSLLSEPVIAKDHSRRGAEQKAADIALERLEQMEKE